MREFEAPAGPLASGVEDDGSGAIPAELLILFVIATA
jgi:hypothetical protein